MSSTWISALCVSACVCVCMFWAHTHTNTLNICADALLSSGQAWGAGAGGAWGSGGVQHASGAVQAPPTPWWRQPIRGERTHAGVVQQRDRRPFDACTQRHHPYLPPMVRPHYITPPRPPTLTPNTGPCWTWFWFLSKLLWKLVTTQ